MTVKSVDDKQAQAKGAADTEGDKPSLRDTITSAMKEVSDSSSDDSSSSDDDIKAKPKSSKKEAKSSKEDVDDDLEDGETEEEDTKKTKTAKDDKSDDASGEEDLSDDKLLLDDDKRETPVKPKEKAPSHLPKEVQDSWDKIPSNIQQYITKSHKEIADQKAELGRKAAHYRDMDAVVSRYEPAIRQYGVTPAQTVERLFQWMDALSGPHKLTAFQHLAKNFGIDFNNFVPDDAADDDTADNNQQVVVPPEVQQKLATLESTLTTFMQQQQEQRDKSAADMVNNWAGLQPDGTFKNKPHFEAVRGLMYNILQSGTLPLINGRLDLDGAYEAACHAHPNVRTLLEQERADKDKEERLAREKEQKAKLQLKKAKQAAVSIAPGAPGKVSSGNADTRKAKPNGKMPSVRDTILQAMQEVNN